MIDHVCMQVSDYAQSKLFYQKALEPVGYKLLMEVAGFAGLGLENGGGAIAALWLYQGENSNHQLHLAFTAENREMVDQFYQAALNAGGKDNGKPGLRTIYHPHYYGAFVFDPDGNNIEVVCHYPENEPVENIVTEFVESFVQVDDQKMENLLAENVRSYITNATGGVNLLKGRDAFMENIRALNVKDVKPSVKITQLLKIKPDQVMVMVEIKAARKEKTLHSHAAYLMDIKNGQIAEMRMVEALPAYSDEFWK